jgi:molecular chaperone GrpE (heat shock protein)
LTPDELSLLRQQLNGIEDLLQHRKEQNDTQKHAFERLYQELEQYKKDFIFQAEKPLLLDLLLFFDSLTWFKQSLLSGETSRDVLADSFQYLIDEFMELLYRRDVLPQETSPVFDPKTQRAIQVVPTPLHSDDQRIEKVLKRGFSRAGRPLRAEEVIVQRYHEQESVEIVEVTEIESPEAGK